MWRDWQVGQEVWYRGREYDGYFEYNGVVTEKHQDHLIIEADGMHLWCDDNNQDLFASELHKYGMRLRGFSPGCQPMNGLCTALDDRTGEYYSILVYDRELTDKEVRDYELDQL